ncbi:MAG: IS91 family transposase [Anaerolineae bacterium]|nr:IS91 family transposase [Anaerolineae bacterium]
MTEPITLQSILQRHLGDYSQDNKLDSHRLKVCDHLQACHTPALGGISYRCDQCESEIPLYHSCRDRHCPQCQNRASRQWRDKQQQAVLPVTYYHLVFTLPHELNGWVQLHPEIIYALLFKAVWKTLKAFGADRKRLNGKLGMTGVLHTWGQNLSQHVHLHCLVPGGALTDDNHWHWAKSNYLFPVKALSRHYRGNLVSALRHSAGEGLLHRVTRTNEVDQVLDQLMQKDWVVYSKHCLNRTDSIIGYLARYTHRIAISNQRLIDINRDQVRFSYKDYKTDQHRVMALHPSEFIRRFLMHVLPKGLMRIRHYGILANRCRQVSVNIIRKILITPAPENTENTISEPATYPCPKCRKGQLIPKHKITPTTVWGHPHPG